MIKPRHRDYSQYFYIIVLLNYYDYINHDNSVRQYLYIKSNILI